MTNLEFGELISRIEKKGLSGLIQILMERDSLAYTRNGRLNKSALCRKLKMSTKDLDNALMEIRKEFA